MASALLALVPLRIEQAALGRRRDWKVLHTGMGPERARIAAARGLALLLYAATLALPAVTWYFILWRW